MIRGKGQSNPRCLIEKTSRVKGLVLPSVLLPKFFLIEVRLFVYSSFCRNLRFESGRFLSRFFILTGWGKSPFGRVLSIAWVSGCVENFVST